MTSISCWRCWLYSILLYLLLLTGLAEDALADTVKHPMDSLTAAEYETAVVILQDEGLVDAASRYPFMRLQSPPQGADAGLAAGRSV